jgi:molecular chaperone DnaK
MKRELSVEMVVEHEIRDVVLAANGARMDVVARLTRMELEALALPLIDRTLEVTRQSLNAARLDPADFNKIILVGGSTRMPLIAKRVGEFFAQPPSGRVNPDEVVALGAAIQAHALVRTRDEGAKPAKANPPREPAPAPVRAPAPAPAPAPARAPAQEAREHARTLQPSVDSRREVADSLASRAPNDTAVDVQVAMPARPVRLPPAPESVTGSARARAHVDYAASSPEAGPSRPRQLPGGAGPERFSGHESGASPFGGASPGSAIEPDLSLDLDGARWEAERERLRAEGGIVAKANAALLVDVTPLSLLVETVGGFCDVLIIGNTPVPCDKTRVFRTAQDNQTRVSIRVAQGNSNRFDQNHYLGELELSGIRPGKRGEAAIGVTFELDADGILNVKARDRDSGIETRAQLRSFAALTDVSDVAAMIERQNRHQVM